MKKKLFLVTLMVAMLVCVLAISVGAVTGSTSNEYGKVTYVDGISEVNGYDTTSRAVVQNTDGTYTTYPAYYVFNGSTGINMKVDFTKLNNATGEGYSKASLIRVEVFENSRLNWTFQNCSSLIDVYLPDSVYFHYASFTGCSSLTTIKIPSAATQIPTECFNNCTSLSSIDIPNTVISLGQSAFQNCVSLSEIKFPEGYTGIVPQDFRKITNWGLERVSVTYIIPKGCTGVNSKYSLDNCEVEKIIFTGTASSTFVADVTKDAPNWVSKIEYANHCDVYYDKVHNAEMEYVFTSFVDECYTEGVCSRCNVKSEGERFAPIFTCLGYSAPENGDGGIAIGFTVNNESIKEYEEATGKTLKHGVFAVAKEKLGTNDIFNKDNGTVADGVVNAEITSYEFVLFELKIVGFTDEYKDIKLAMGAYVAVTDGETTEYSYLQSGTPAENEKYCFVSYNDIVGKSSTEEEVSQ